MAPPDSPWEPRQCTLVDPPAGRNPALLWVATRGMGAARNLRKTKCWSESDRVSSTAPGGGWPARWQQLPLPQPPGGCAPRPPRSAAAWRYAARRRPSSSIGSGADAGSTLSPDPARCDGITFSAVANWRRAREQRMLRRNRRKRALNAFRGEDVRLSLRDPCAQASFTSRVAEACRAPSEGGCRLSEAPPAPPAGTQERPSERRGPEPPRRPPSPAHSAASGSTQPRRFGGRPAHWWAAPSPIVPVEEDPSDPSEAPPPPRPPVVPQRQQDHLWYGLRHAPHGNRFGGHRPRPARRMGGAY
eukprot:TRINITY_DN36477_c0_g1_i1.p2 TRINITY_DN36477_c0_g1~~TRINITY_DN36477_c0_g1_i1.p2  ORF type:complete len:336 (+),score=81.17 TRINITY_DN36477_c0_g1_i1:104-1009(+)